MKTWQSWILRSVVHEKKDLREIAKFYWDLSNEHTTSGGRKYYYDKGKVMSKDIYFMDVITSPATDSTDSVHVYTHTPQYSLNSVMFY